MCPNALFRQACRFEVDQFRFLMKSTGRSSCVALPTDAMNPQLLNRIVSRPTIPIDSFKSSILQHLTPSLHVGLYGGHMVVLQCPPSDNILRIEPTVSCC